MSKFRTLESALVRCSLAQELIGEVIMSLRFEGLYPIVGRMLTTAADGIWGVRKKLEEKLQETEEKVRE